MRNGIDWVFIGIVCILLFLFVSLYRINKSIDDSQDVACKELGFENFLEVRMAFPDYCEDKEGNLYAVTMECDNNFQLWKKPICKAKRIEVK